MSNQYKFLSCCWACGNCEKAERLLLGFFKLLWKSASFADFHQQRQFPQASCLFFLLLFLSSPSFRVFCKKVLASMPLATTQARSVDL